VDSSFTTIKLVHLFSYTIGVCIILYELVYVDSLGRTSYTKMIRDARKDRSCASLQRLNYHDSKEGLCTRRVIPYKNATVSTSHSCMASIQNTFHCRVHRKISNHLH